MRNFLNLGMRGHDTPYTNIDDLANALGSLGATHVQLALQKSLPDVVTSPSTLTPFLGHEIKNKLRAQNCRISVLGCYIDPIHPDPEIRKANLDWFKANLKFAKYLEADMVGTETGFLSCDEETYSEENYQCFLESMKELVSYAEKLGVCIGIEPVWRNTIHSPESMKRLLDDLNSPNITVIYDATNLADSDDPEKQHELMDRMFKLCGDRIGIFHFKDFRMVEGGKEGHIATEGNLDYPYLIKSILKNMPYADAILEETNPDTFPIIEKKVRAIWDAAANEM